ncbi:hypothetical protein [Apis mellifera associated microvirus 35]|nr:hypothetical protein [Apis mellifera associated microvirus 35]
MIKYKFKASSRTTKQVNKSAAVPNQSLTVEQIVERFVRGIPVDVVQRKPVYIDQETHDFEKLNRLDFAEKTAMAEQIRAENEAIYSDLQERERAQRESDQRRAEERAGGARTAGIEDLDNTMPDDTSIEDQPVRKKPNNPKK